MTDEAVFVGIGAGVTAAHFGFGVAASASVGLLVWALLSIVVRLALIRMLGRQR